MIDHELYTAIHRILTERMTELAEANLLLLDNESQYRYTAERYQELDALNSRIEKLFSIYGDMNDE